MAIERNLVARLHRQANADRWHLSIDRFGAALDASASRAFAAGTSSPGEVERYLRALHLEDLALACACADGDEAAWEHFILEQRPHLYRAAAAIDPSGGARDLADSLYAELFGLRERGGERQSLFRYFHGRSSLGTWLRAILAQRHVDRLRTDRRVEELPDEESAAALPAPRRTIDPDRERHLALMQAVLEQAVAGLTPRDRLRLACYYAQDMTLADTGRLLGEHEATSSRHLARTRKMLRDEVTRTLQVEHRLSDAEIADCFAGVSEDAGPLDLDRLLGAGPAAGRKESALDRSR